MKNVQRLLGVLSITLVGVLPAFPESGGLNFLAQKAPRNAGLFLAWEESSLDLKALLQEARQVPAAASLEQLAGVNLDEMVHWAQPAGFLALIPPPC